MQDYRQFSPALFNHNVPVPNVFDLTDPDYPGRLLSVSVGGSSTGSGLNDGNVTTQDVTYNLPVQPVPEPASFLLAGAG